MKISDISEGLLDYFKDRGTNQKAQQYHGIDVNGYYQNWVRGLANGSYTATPAGLEAFRHYLETNRPPAGVKIQAPLPQSYNGSEIKKWIDAAIREKNAETAKPPQAAPAPTPPPAPTRASKKAAAAAASAAPTQSANAVAAEIQQKYGNMLPAITAELLKLQKVVSTPKTP